jgi:hypothetical protein
MKVYHDFRHTMVQPSRWKSFRALGLDCDTRSDRCRRLFNEIKLRGTAGFRELWSIYFPLDRLSRRHPTPRFGWSIRQRQTICHHYIERKKAACSVALGIDSLDSLGVPVSTSDRVFRSSKSMPGCSVSRPLPWVFLPIGCSGFSHRVGAMSNGFWDGWRGINSCAIAVRIVSVQL